VEAADQSAATAQSHGQPPQASGRGTQNGQTGGSSPAGQPPPATRRGSRLALKNWHVRSRLLLLIAIPTLVAVVLGGARILSSVQSGRAYQRVETLASLGQDTIALTQALEEERDQIVFYIALGSAGGRADGLATNPAVRSQAALELSVVQRSISSTTQTAAQVRALAGQIGSSYSAQTQQSAATALTALGELPFLRSASLSTQLPALTVVQKYTQVINDVLALNDETAQGVGDPELAQTVRVIGLVSAMKEEASQQRAILAAALLHGQFGAGELAAIEAAQSAQQSNLAAFDISANVGQRLLWNNSVDQSFAYLANSEELQALSLQNSTGSLHTDPTSPVDWFGAMSNTIDFQMGSVEHQLAAAVVSRAASLRKSAIISAAAVGAAVLLVLGLALLFTTIVGRSMIRPLQRLRSGALEVAGVRLPAAVRRLSETDDQPDGLEVEPIDVDSSDEIGEVARAFDHVHREALQLAANEAALRGNVNAMFVNLSRRSQSLVERQIRLIDDLEQGEQDAERLGNLFQMDHLATRMRRNSENLLVLAGHDLSKRWNQPVALVDVLRAAVSEIEEYERVSLNVQPGIAVRGQAVNDVVHLLAELAENATSLSSADTPVNISGHLLTSGGVLLDITDQGVGMGAEEMAHANWRLDNPPVVDVAVSRRMGLFVVGRLAARHGIRVRLRPASSGGLTALVWLPDEVITQSTPAGPGMTGFDTAESGPGELEAELAGLGGGEWVDPDRTAAEQEVSAARTPKFASLRADAEETPLGPRRVPGAALRPAASWSTTGTVFESGAQGNDGTEEPSGVGPLPAGPSNGSATAGQEPPPDGEQPSQDEPASEPAASAGPQPVEGAGGESFGTVPRPAVDDGTEPFGTVPRPAAGGDAESHGTGRQSGLSLPVNGESQTAEPAVTPMGAPASYRWETGLTNGEVIVPPAESLADENRLPIFEAVESDWFRHGRSALGWSSGAEKPEESWASPGDEGWRAAETVPAPSSAGLTPAGLPKRVPQANLVPGSAASSLSQAPTRSAAATRERFASFQRGVKEARAAATGGEESDGEDETS
jgi:Nitrate and nitrite sensing/HAMP domain